MILRSRSNGIQREWLASQVAQAQVKEVLYRRGSRHADRPFVGQIRPPPSKVKQTHPKIPQPPTGGVVVPRCQPNRERPDRIALAFRSAGTLSWILSE